jgi:hypothetical protein
VKASLPYIGFQSRGCERSISIFDVSTACFFSSNERENSSTTTFILAQSISSTSFKHLMRIKKQRSNLEVDSLICVSSLQYYLPYNIGRKNSTPHFLGTVPAIMLMVVSESKRTKIEYSNAVTNL